MGFLIEHWRYSEVQSGGGALLCWWYKAIAPRSCLINAVERYIKCPSHGVEKLQNFNSVADSLGGFNPVQYSRAEYTAKSACYIQGNNLPTRVDLTEH